MENGNMYSRRDFLYLGSAVSIGGILGTKTKEAFSGNDLSEVDFLQIFERPLGSKLPYISRISIENPESYNTPYPFPGVLQVQCTHFYKGVEHELRVVSTWEHLFSEGHKEHTRKGIAAYMAGEPWFAKHLADLLGPHPFPFSNNSNPIPYFKREPNPVELRLAFIGYFIV